MSILMGVAVFKGSCPFCKIVRKQAVASYVYEDERVAAFMDIRPLNEGHTLVILKRHFETIYDVPDEEVAHLYVIVRRIARAVKKGVSAEGVTISQHNERAAGQDIFHLHVHVIPRYEGQKLPKFEEVKEAPRERLDDVAQKIKQHL